MNFSSLKYLFGCIGLVLAMVSLLQACHESYGTANISTISGRMIDDRAETPVKAGVLCSLKKYVLEEINYPSGAIINEIEGTVYIKFTIDDKGDISKVSAVGDRIGYGLEEEAIRVVNSLPQHLSTAMKGKVVLPIIYKLNSNNNSHIRTFSYLQIRTSTVDPLLSGI